MTAPIGGFTNVGPGTGPQQLGLNIAGENGLSGLQANVPLGGTSFGDTLKNALGQVSEAQDTAQDYIGRFVRGEPVELHQVMSAAEEAEISLEMLVELRSKLTDAYKTVMNMG